MALASKVGIVSATADGGGLYTFKIFFESSASSKYTDVGDTIEDSTGNKYQITTWVGYPSDFVSGGFATASFSTTDILPQVDIGFDSFRYTPNQINYFPEVQTAGTLHSINLFSGKDYEYELGAVWVSGAQSSIAVVGDRVLDSTGKEYEITFIDPLGFGELFRMKEVEKVGQVPASGVGSLFRATSLNSLYQGSDLSDPARTVVRNRDNKIVDLLLGTGAGGGSVNGDYTPEYHTITSGEAIAKSFTLNNTPDDPTEVLVDVINGSSQQIGIDYQIAGDVFSWAGLTLDGLLETGDRIRLIYFT